MRFHITTVIPEGNCLEVRYIKEIVPGPDGKGISIRWTRYLEDAQSWGAEHGVVLGWVRMLEPNITFARVMDPNHGKEPIQLTRV